MPKVVIDTNVVVSGVIARGKPYQVLGRCAVGADVAYATTAMLDELATVLTRPGLAARLSAQGTGSLRILSAYRTLAVPTLLGPMPSVQSVDPDDDKFLACAEACAADYLITGDRHLLDLRTVGPTRIVTPADFLALVEPA